VTRGEPREPSLIDRAREGPIFEKKAFAADVLAKLLAHRPKKISACEKALSMELSQLEAGAAPDV
jgi:hypothetical protein